MPLLQALVPASNTPTSCLPNAEEDCCQSAHCGRSREPSAAKHRCRHSEHVRSTGTRLSRGWLAGNVLLLNIVTSPHVLYCVAPWNISRLYSAVSEPAQRVQRERKARIVYSPATPVRNRAGKRAPATAAAAPKGNSPVALKMKSQVRPAKTSKDRSTTETPEKKQLLLQEQSTSDDAEKSSAESGTPEYKKLEGRVKGQVYGHQCQHHYTISTS